VAQVRVVAEAARHRETVADQLVAGLVSGALAGWGLTIEGRDATCIRFRRHVFLPSIPDSGLIKLRSPRDGYTEVQCELTCTALRRRTQAIALLVGLAVAVALHAVALGATPLLLLAAGIIAFATYDRLAWRHHRLRLAGQLRAYINNINYLKSF